MNDDDFDGDDVDHDSDDDDHDGVDDENSDDDVDDVVKILMMKTDWLNFLVTFSCEQ